MAFWGLLLGLIRARPEASVFLQHEGETRARRICRGIVERGLRPLLTCAACSSDGVTKVRSQRLLFEKNAQYRRAGRGLQ